MRPDNRFGKLKGSFHPYAFTTIVFWALAYVYTRLALQHFSPFALGFLRYFVASVILIVVGIVMKLKLPKPRDWPWFILSGAAGFFLYMILFNLGSVTVTAATGSVIIAIVPVLTALFATTVFGEKLRRLQWLAMMVQFAGILVLALFDGILSLNFGVVWLLLAVLALSTYNLTQRKLTRTYSAMQATTYSILCGTAMLAIFAPAGFREWQTAPPEQKFYILLLGLVPSVLAYICWAKAFEKAASTSAVSNYMFLNPLMTSVFAFLIVGEVPTVSTMAGGVIILLGAYLFNRREFGSES